MNNLQYIYGIHPVLEALKAGNDIQKILIERSAKGENISAIKALARKLEIGFQEAPTEKFRQFHGKNHQGVVAITSPVTFVSAENLLPQIFEKGQAPLLLVLDRITDVGNFGAILRTAAAAGVHGVIFPAKETAQLNAATAKASAGAIFSVNLCRTSDLPALARTIKNSGVQIISCATGGTKSIYDIDFTLPSAIVAGSEKSGIHPAILQMSDAVARIPMPGKIESLNVSVAAAVALFEAVRQRGGER